MSQKSLLSQVLSHLRRQVETGQLSPGEQLPTIAELCVQLGVSAWTVREAIRILGEEGVLESRRGSGVYVRAQRTEKPLLRGEQTVALLVGEMGSRFFAGIVRGAEQACHQAGFRLVVAGSHFDPEREEKLLDELSREVAGIMAVPLAKGDNFKAYATLVQRQVPFVFIDSFVAGLDAPIVATDNERGGYEAARHLLSMGRETIFVLSGEPHTSFEARLNGYKRALSERRIAFDPALVFHATHDTGAWSYRAVREIIPRLQAAPLPAIFAFSDSLARGTLVALHEAGLRVPHDVALCGFDDIDAVNFEPPLTTIRQDTHRLGELGAQTLLHLVRYGGATATSSRAQRVARPPLLVPELIVRSTSDPNSTFSLARNYAARFEPGLEPTRKPALAV